MSIIESIEHCAQYLDIRIPMRLPKNKRILPKETVQAIQFRGSNIYAIQICDTIRNQNCSQAELHIFHPMLTQKDEQI